MQIIVNSFTLYSKQHYHRNKYRVYIHTNTGKLPHIHTSTGTQANTHTSTLAPYIQAHAQRHIHLQELHCI